MMHLLKQRELITDGSTSDVFSPARYQRGQCCGENSDVVFLVSVDLAKAFSRGNWPP